MSVKKGVETVDEYFAGTGEAAWERLVESPEDDIKEVEYSEDDAVDESPSEQLQNEEEFE